MEVKFYTFRKKDNSTARPSGSTSLQVRLKDSSSVINPVIEVATQEKPFKYNYAYIPEYDRYYFVSDWTWTVGFWQAELVVDVLASWKDTIGATPLYVLRSARAFNGGINDDMYPTTAQPIIKEFKITDGATFPWFNDDADLDDGVYVIGVVNAAQATQGAASYYVLSNDQLRNLLHYLMDNTGYLEVPTDVSVNGIPDELLKTLYNPFQYIVSCKWFPGYTGGNATTIRYGWWDSSVSARQLNGAIRYYDGVIYVDLHPQAAARGVYLNGNPYTRIELVCEPFGMIPIDATIFTTATTRAIKLRCIVDYITGAATLIISVGDTVIKTVSANMGVDIQLAQMAVDRLTQAETVITGSAEVTRSVFSLKNVIDPVAGAAGAVSSTAHAIADGIRSSFPQTQINGVNGSLLFTHIKSRCIVYYYQLVNEDRDHNGRPLCEVRTPASLGGYMLIRDADVATSGTAEEDTRIRAYLESGFYYE